MRPATLGLLCAGLVGSGGGAADPEKAPTLYLFLSRDAPGAGEVARRVVDFILERKGAVSLRPVLLVEDFATVGRLDEKSALFVALRELGRLSKDGLDIPLYDEEGLDLARSWKVRRLPALVLVAGGRAHAAAGSGVRPQDVLECP